MPQCGLRHGSNFICILLWLHVRLVLLGFDPGKWHCLTVALYDGIASLFEAYINYESALLTG